MASRASAVLNIARSYLGYHEGANNATIFGSWSGAPNQAWCDSFASYCANKAGATDICGKFTYTPSHAKWFANRGQWNKTPSVGAFVFFAFNGPTYQGRWLGISHVGLVEAVRADGSIATIEGNTDNMTMRHVRRANIVGYGHPAYLPEVAAPAVDAPSVAGNIVLHRFLNQKNGDRFYTESAGEAQALYNTHGVYKYEGPAYEFDLVKNTQALYRCYSPTLGLHFYSIAKDEGPKARYYIEGTLHSSASGPIAVHRFYNLRNGTHFYTASEAEKANVIRTMAKMYKYEGVGWKIA